WGVRLGSFPDQAAALALYDRAAAAGYGTRIVPLGRGEQARYEVRLGQIPSGAEAESLATRLSRELDLPGIKAYRR
ncbi:MAG TPA: SPOR domain-containing protein, partial [Rhodocyclaceae bacterium]|nr:SPOR domain-containing protein [Rhodocyclaceae bacterium]